MIHSLLDNQNNILHQLNLGQHLLLMMNDGGIEVTTMTGQIPHQVATVVQLTSEETYHLYCSLHAQYQLSGENLVANIVYRPDDLCHLPHLTNEKTDPRVADESRPNRTC